MADVKLKQDTALTNVIDDNAALADGARAAGDYDNTSLLDLEAWAIITVQYDTTTPTAGDLIGELYLIPGEDDTTPTYPDGGDAGLGTDDTPQAIFLIGVFESINPSLAANEFLATRVFDLYPNNRFIVLNTSGASYDATWQLDIVPMKRQVG